MANAPFTHLVETDDELRTIYRQPHELAKAKERPVLDAASQAFISSAPFLVVATFGADGTADASPRGGEPGFVQVLDESRLAIGDLGGNNRLDTLQNILATNRVGLVFVHPGKTETVRVNGQAWVSTDPDLLGRFPYPKPAKSAIVVQVESTYIHCGKAFMRSHLWEPETWAAFAEQPDASDILACQNPGTYEAETIRRDLSTGYDHALADERGEDPIPV